MSMTFMEWQELSHLDSPDDIVQTSPDNSIIIFSQSAVIDIHDNTLYAYAVVNYTFNLHIQQRKHLHVTQGTYPHAHKLQLLNNL